MSDINLNAESVESTLNSDSLIINPSRDAANGNNKGVDDIVEVGGDGNGIENENDTAVTTEHFPGSNGRGVSRDSHGQPPEENLSFEIEQTISGGEVQGNIRRRRGPRSRSSLYRGVTFYRRTGRWESHIWYLENFLIFFMNLLFC